jgi:ribonuclease P protein component
MIPAIYRLRSNRSFEVVYKRGRSVSDEYLVVTQLPGKYPTLKVGFVCGKKVGKAVCRNKVKRRLREAFYALIPRLEGNTSYVVVARSKAGQADYHTLASSLEGLLAKVGKLH